MDAPTSTSMVMLTSMVGTMRTLFPDVFLTVQLASTIVVAHTSTNMSIVTNPGMMGWELMFLRCMAIITR